MVNCGDGILQNGYFFNKHNPTQTITISIISINLFSKFKMIKTFGNFFRNKLNSICPKINICTNTHTRTIAPQNTTQNTTRCAACAEDEFSCWDSACIPNDRQCDGYSDCTSGEDELYCSTTTPAPTESTDAPDTDPYPTESEIEGESTQSKAICFGKLTPRQNKIDFCPISTLKMLHVTPN